MKELKHLIFFESLLEDTNNELVRKAESEGDLAFGYTCFHAPEVLLNLGNCFSVRLRAPHTNSMELATYYMANNSCEFSRALLERALEGNYSFLHAMIGVDVCEANNRAIENMEILHTQGEDKDKFFYCNLDIPYSDDEDCVEHIREQVSRKILKPMMENYGVDTSDTAIRESVREHNEVCRIMTEINAMREAENPVITGYEFHVINLVSQVCPHYLIKPYLEETLEELKTREPEEKFPFRARVVLVGSEVDDPEFTKLIETCGAMVVADRYCFGSIPGREEIIVKPDEDILQAIADHYIQTNQCPRSMGPENVVARKQFLYKIAQEYGAEGVIVENMKFCEYWGYERAQDGMWFYEGYELPRSIPVCQIEKDYTSAASGQLRTRFQAFVESIEIKKIQEGK